MPDSQDNLNGVFSLAIDVIRLGITLPVDEVTVKNVYVDVDDTHIRVVPFDFTADIDASGLIVNLPPTTLGSIYEIQLLSQGKVVLSAYFDMPKSDCFLSDLPLYTAFPPRESYPVDTVNWGDIKGDFVNQTDLSGLIFTATEANQLKQELAETTNAQNTTINEGLEGISEALNGQVSELTQSTNTKTTQLEQKINTDIAGVSGQINIVDEKVESNKIQLEAKDAELQGQINANGGGKFAYVTYAEMEAAAALPAEDSDKLSANSSIDIIKDPDGSKNGTYAYDGSVFTKSPYDPLTLSKSYTDTAKADTLSKVQNTFDTKVLMVASPLSDGSKAFVGGDPELDNNGFYKKTAGVWVKNYNFIYDLNKYTEKAVGSLESELKESFGVSTFADYRKVVNGTAISTIGNPPLTPVGEVFTIVDGYAVPAATVTRKNIAALWHEYNAEGATARAYFDTSAQSLLESKEVGLYVQRQQLNIGSFFIFDRDTSTIRFAWSIGNAITTIASQVTALPVNMTKWMMEVSSLGSNKYSCVIETLDGTRSAPFVVDGFYSSVTTPHRPRFGVFVAMPKVKIGYMKVDATDVTNDRKIAELENTNEFPDLLPMPVEVSAKQHIVQGDLAYQQDYERSEAIFIDNFDAANGTVFPSAYTPSFGDLTYRTFGTATYAVQENAVAVTQAGTGTALADWGLAGFDAVLPAGWYHKSRGFEMRATVSIPDGLSEFSVVIRYDKGAQATDNAGALIIQKTSNGVIFKSLSEVRSGESVDSNATYHTELYPAQQTIGRDVDVVVRCYNSEGRGDTHDLIIASIDGVRVGKFFYEPAVDDTKLSLIRDIKSVGIGFNPLLTTVYSTRVKKFTIAPVPVAGSSAYRTAPPEPAPAVPNFTAPQMIFDGWIDADVNAQEGYGGILGPSIIPMLDYAGSLGVTPVGNYYMYYSTNHAVGEGGIWLATAPNPEGPWTKYNGDKGLNRIYFDAVEGTDSEQPQVVYDELENRLIMIYHQGGVGNAQVSMLALSTDGINWTRQGQAADTSPELRRAYVRHDGYSSFCAKDPLGVVTGWLGWFRLTGGTGVDGGIASLWSTARSPDGVNWTTDLLPIMIPSLKRPQHNQSILHNVGYGATPFAYLGQRLLPIAPFRSAGQGSADSVGYLAITRLGDDMRNMSAEEHVIEKTLPTEEGVITVSSVFVRGNTLYLYYIAKTRYLHLITADLSKPPKGVVRTLD